MGYLKFRSFSGAEIALREKSLRLIQEGLPQHLQQVVPHLEPKEKGSDDKKQKTLEDLPDYKKHPEFRRLF